jgi:hypothetical protein
MGGMQRPQSRQRGVIEFNSGFPRQSPREQSARHADAPVNAPDRDVNAFLLQRGVPCQNMVIDAVDQRAVEIEKE